MQRSGKKKDFWDGDSVELVDTGKSKTWRRELEDNVFLDPTQARRPEMRRISASAPIRISHILTPSFPLWKCAAFPSGPVNRECETRRVSSAKARANHAEDSAFGRRSGYSGRACRLLDWRLGNVGYARRVDVQLNEVNFHT
ncbi:Dihydrolipoamide acetyltransferase component of pyruvate dehydrogenase complex [Fusarium oxysporum f. sp. albedinis]|nr:Dihydrolipoamide acetyltransferase component of pyruvate dehydrogenase complex [Fusarium oxysporum f. sp. albedinis]